MVTLKKLVHTRLGCFLLAAALLSGSATALAAPDDPEFEYAGDTVTENGYLTLSDGTRLRYHMEKVAAAPPGPVLMQYDGYDAGTGSYFSNIPAVKARLMRRGYTILGVSVRGTGCSSGAFSLFDPQRALDGAEAVEWAAGHAWSDGNVGMIGYSYPGIMQLFVAAQRPPHLRAIAPSNVIFDLYRDVGSPGGIPNGAFASLFTVQQEAPGLLATGEALDQGDPECAANHARNRLAYESFVAEALMSPYIDGPFRWRERSPATTAAAIDVPVLSINYWQDEQTGSRIGGLLEKDGLPEVLGVGRKGRNNRTWTVWSNGNHDLTWDHPLHSEMLIAFYEHYLRGVDNGWERTPPIQLLHELSASASEPAWITTHGKLPKPAPATLYLREAGTLRGEPPAVDETADSYAYPVMSSVTNPLPGETDVFHQLWRMPAPAVGRLVWTTPALAEDVQLLGSASVDLWLRSTATDTDVQVTLTEVRPDGQEMYVARGWLRASNRALDPARSTPTRPFHRFTEGAAAELAAGEATLMRVEVFPFAHRFRAGSAMRLIVDAPVGTTGDWGAYFNPGPARNEILHDRAHPSRLVIGVLKDDQERPPARPCGEMANQPCRESIAPVPPGRISLRPDRGKTR